ncbi:MAG: hypothetical protein KDJ88_08080 [Bauldia sp.]|nr:hypothetical protein [Bauldia sp.]
MAKKSTRKSAASPVGEKPVPAEPETRAADAAKAEASPEPETAKTEASPKPEAAKTEAETETGPVVAKPADAAATESAAAASGDEASKADVPAKTGLPGLSEIPVPASLMAAAIANRRRLAKWLNSRAAMIAIAAGLGAVVGSLVSNGVGPGDSALRASIDRLTTELASLKTQMDGTEIVDASPGDGIDPATTGSIAASPPIAEDWTLWRVRNGRALVQGSSGYFEVAPGSRLPELGLVEAITRHGDSWQVETRGGLILPRG